MKSGGMRKRLAIGASAAAFVCMGALAGSAPAFAFDDKPSTFEPLLGMVGLGKDNDEKPDIDFRERPKLVVPKGNALPPPQAGSSTRGANWPQDVDTTRRRAAEAAARAPRQIEVNKDLRLSRTEIDAGRSNAPETSQTLCDSYNSGAPDCGARTPVEKLKQVFSLGGGDNSDTVTPGYEPKREYLTEPPSGYRKARTAQKATTEKPRERKDEANAAEYYRDQARRNRGIQDDE